MATEPLPLFIYGTLLPGQSNFGTFLEDRILRCEPAVTEGLLYYIREGDYPYVIPGSGCVKGALVVLAPQTRDQTLRDLDQLEDYDPSNEKESLYLRRKTLITLKSGERRQAWIYYWNGPSCAGELLPEGDFTVRGS